VHDQHVIVFVANVERQRFGRRRGPGAAFWQVDREDRAVRHAGRRTSYRLSIDEHGTRRDQPLQPIARDARRVLQVSKKDPVDPHTDVAAVEYKSLAHGQERTTKTRRREERKLKVDSGDGLSRQRGCLWEQGLP
jgi:hypothetical protein